MTAAAFSGDYVDLKFIKSRKVAQIVVEIPIEQSAAFVAAFGAPSPATGVPVAIARLVDSKASTPSPAPAIEKERKPFNTLPPAQQAALRCNEPGFWKFLSRDFLSGEVENADQAAVQVRALCAVDSRSELNRDPKGAAIWRELDDGYFRWQRGM